MRFIRPLVIGGMLAACGGGSGNGGMSSSIYTSVTIAPSAADAYEFSATPTVLHVTTHDQNNGAMSSAGGVTVWHVSPAGFASVNSSGELEHRHRHLPHRRQLLLRLRHPRPGDERDGRGPLTTPVLHQMREPAPFTGAGSFAFSQPRA